MGKTPTSPAPTSTTPAAAPAAASKLPPLEAIHDAVEQARNLRQALQNEKQRIGCFLGAGCPRGIYNDVGKTSMELIPVVVELTKRVAVGLDNLDKAPKSTSQFKKAWDCLCKECKGTEDAEPTVEDVLTEIRTLTNRRGTAKVADITKEELQTLDTAICTLITAEMEKSLPPHRCSYHRFASWLGGLQPLTPVEIFSPNYDLLFEQAFEQNQLPHFDGFVGSREPFFDLSSIEHDAIPARWTRLWKVHGSINWEKIEEDVDGKPVTRVIRVTRKAQAGKVMIYPSHLKYEQSRRMPYLAMLDRLRAFFRADSTKKDVSWPLLVVCGYSFLDDHLNEVLLDGLRGNRKAHCFALMYSNLADAKRVAGYAEKQHNLTVLAWDGAVIGGRKGLYRAGTAGGDECRPWLCEEDAPTGDPAKPTKLTRCRLGDFHFFGLFLEQLSGGLTNDEHVSTKL